MPASASLAAASPDTSLNLAAHVENSMRGAMIRSGAASSRPPQNDHFRCHPRSIRGTIRIPSLDSKIPRDHQPVDSSLLDGASVSDRPSTARFTLHRSGDHSIYNPGFVLVSAFS